MKWTLTSYVKKLPKLKSPVLIEGMPGIGNVGKVAMDFIIEETKAEKIYDIFSYDLPHSVFINEDNLIELPTISMYFKKSKKADLLFLAGDVQPVNERSCYEFSEEMLDIFMKFGGKELITLGGIGLPVVPKKPKVYCTGNTKKIIDEYKSDLVSNKLYGVVGPIVGVSGLLLGLASRRKIEAITFLAETYGHPMYLGIKGAKEILKVLNKQLSLSLDINKLDKEIKDIESEIIKKTGQISDVTNQIALKKLQKKLGKDVDYIG